MYQSIPKPPIPPGQSPGIWLALIKLHTVGNLTRNEARPVRHLNFLSKCLSAVRNKRISQFFCFSMWSAFTGRCSCRFHVGFFCCRPFSVDCLNWPNSGEFYQNFSKKSNAQGFAPVGGEWAVLELTGTLLWRKGEEDYFPPRLRVRIKDHKNSLHGKFHRFSFSFSSKFSDLNFASIIYPCYNNNNNSFIKLLKKAFQLNLQCKVSNT